MIQVVPEKAEYGIIKCCEKAGANYRNFNLYKKDYMNVLSTCLLFLERNL